MLRPASSRREETRAVEEVDSSSSEWLSSLTSSKLVQQIENWIDRGEVHSDRHCPPCSLRPGQVPDLDLGNCFLPDWIARRFCAAVDSVVVPTSSHMRSRRTQRPAPVESEVCSRVCVISPVQMFAPVQSDSLPSRLLLL